MKKLLNTLYITQPDVYLTADGDNIVIKKEERSLLRMPLINLDAVNCFSYLGASPSLMRKCAENNININFFSPNGSFQARVIGRVKGNVVLRKQQLLISEDPIQSAAYARNFIIGKIYNARKVVERVTRDHPYTVDMAALDQASLALKTYMTEIEQDIDVAGVMAFEGIAAKTYFSVFDQFIVQQKNDFIFTGRNRRPPLDRVNAILSFLYTLLTSDAVSALEGVGLDPYVGFLHQDRPGRPSLALDLMEELRPILSDRLALNLINRQQIKRKDFEERENGAVLLNENGRKLVLTAWQERKREKITHPYLKETIDVGLITHAQAMLLARAIRGDISGYPPFLWS